MKDDQADRIVAAVVQRLKMRRKSLGLSLNKAAELAGMTHVGLLQIERGDRMPMLRTALKLSAALGITLSDVLRAEE